MKMVTVVSVEPIENSKLRVTLSNGRKGIFDVLPYLDTSVFQELKDPRYFRCVFLAYDTIAWPNGQDIAPETIELELQPEPASDKPRARVG